MGYRIVADENVEPATRQYLDKLGHDIEWLGDVPELGLGVTDDEIAAYSIETSRIILTQDDDFFTELPIEDSSGVLFQRDQTLTSREVGDIIEEMSQYIPQRDIDLEYVGRNWL
jgi:predicted nuclease of predicted toxin-antitoxin system